MTIVWLTCTACSIQSPVTCRAGPALVPALEAARAAGWREQGQQWSCPACLSGETTRERERVAGILEQDHED